MTVTQIMPAATTHTTEPTTGMDPKGVNTVAIFESRQTTQKRASEGSAEIERILLLEYVRQRRRADQYRASIETGMYALRNLR